MLKIKNGCYTLSLDNLSTGIRLEVGDPRMEISILIDRENLPELITYLCQHIDAPRPSQCNKPQTYNHAFELAFSVPDSEFPDGEDCLKYEGEKIKRSFFARGGDMFHPYKWRNPETGQAESCAEYLEAMGCYDTYENEEIGNGK